MEEGLKKLFGAPTHMRGEFRKVQAQLRDLGITLSIWDHCGEPLEGFAPSCEFCQLIGESRLCSGEAQKVAQHVVFDDRTVKRRSVLGECLIGVPVYDRRRLVAAAVACFPVVEMLKEEKLHGVCDRLQVDYSLVFNELKRVCRYSAADTERLINILTQMLDREHALCVSQSEIVGLSTNLARTYEELSFVYRISGAMKLTNEPSDFLRKDVCQELLEVLNVQGAAAIVYEKAPAEDDVEVIMAGDIPLASDQIRRLAEDEIAPQFSGDVRSIVTNEFVGMTGSGFDGVIDQLIAVQLVSDSGAIGILMAVNKRDGEFDSVDAKLLGAVGHQAAVFLTNHRLYADMQELLVGVLESLTASLDAKDPYTCGHSLRVARISERLAQELGYSPERVRRIYLAGLLHDVGKIGVPESVLHKPGQLTGDEFDQMKRHPMIAARILGGIRQLKDVAVGILTHHERLDGKGYPQGLRGDDLPMEGRIIGLADCLDAVTSDRCYRSALPVATVCKEIRKHAGTQFDAELTEKLLAIDLEEFLKQIRRDDGNIRPDPAHKEKHE